MLVNNNCLPSPPPQYYGQGDRWLSVLHTRLRLGHNSLNRHLHRIGVRDTQSCECGFAVEGEAHYLLQCPRFQNARTQLLANIGKILGPGSNVHFLSTHRTTYFANILLKGSPELTIHQNDSIFAEVLSYIKASGRFAAF